MAPRSKKSTKLAKTVELPPVDPSINPFADPAALDDPTAIRYANGTIITAADQAL